MKNAEVWLAVGLLAFAFGPQVQAQLGNIDVDENEGDIIHAQPAIQPGTKDNPYRVIVYNECNIDPKGKLTSTEDLRIEVWTFHGPVGLVYVEATDSSLTARLKLDNRQAQTVPVKDIPEQFTFRVIAFDDTACFQVDRTAPLVQATALQESPRFVLEDVWPLKDNILYAQLSEKDKDLKEFVKTLKKVFDKNTVKLTALEPGFYPCLPGNLRSIQRKTIGRKNEAIRTNVVGENYVVFLEVIDPQKYDAVFNWLNGGQTLGLAESKK